MNLSVVKRYIVGGLIESNKSTVALGVQLGDNDGRGFTGLKVAERGILYRDWDYHDIPECFIDDKLLEKIQAIPIVQCISLTEKKGISVGE